MSLLEARDIRFAYEGGEEIISGASLAAESGEAIVVTGLSGCGKSTLCRCLCGIIPQAVEGDFSGAVLCLGKNLSELPLAESAQLAALVFQDPDEQLICSAVEDELAFGLENLCVEPAEIRRRVDETMARFGLTEMALRDPATLSGGQKKLVAIAACLLMGARALILDEPTAGLDEESRSIVLAAIEEALAGGCAVIAAEHDLSLAPYAARVLYMRGGRLYDAPEEGSP